MIFNLHCWQVGADIVKRALSYPLKLIAKNAGVNGSVVTEKVFVFNEPIISCGMLPKFVLYLLLENGDNAFVASGAIQ